MQGAVIPAAAVTEDDKRAMFALMSEFYDNMDEAVFRRDFAEKDHCLILRDDAGAVVGFTTQKVMAVEADGRTVHGVFSGDTIIHRDYWGQTDLYRIFAQFWFEYAKQYDEFYWFLICKGYKTYCILPLVWAEFYPTFRAETPPEMQSIIDAYASALYPDEYNPATGVIEYRHTKDKLKAGVAEIDERRLRNKDIAYFCQANPYHTEGFDIACISKFDASAVKPRMAAMLGI
jgi:hypothetical protein